MALRFSLATLLPVFILLPMLVGCGGERHPEAAGIRTWETDGLAGHVHSVTLLRADVMEDTGALGPEWLVSRTLYDTAGHLLESVARRGDTDYVRTRFRYDSAGELIEQIASPAIVEGESIQYDPDADSVITTISYRLDAAGRCVEKIAASTGAVDQTLLYRYSYDRDGYVTRDSVFDEQGRLNWYTSYDYHPLGGWTVTVHAGWLGRRRTLNEYDYASDRRIRHSSFYFDDSSRTEVEFEKGRQSTLRNVVRGSLSEARYEYLDDERGNWVRCRFLRKEGEEWHRAWEQRRTIEYW